MASASCKRAKTLVILRSVVGAGRISRADDLVGQGCCCCMGAGGNRHVLQWPFVLACGPAPALATTRKRKHSGPGTCVMSCELDRTTASFLRPGGEEVSSPPGYVATRHRCCRAKNPWLRHAMPRWTRTCRRQHLAGTPTQMNRGVPVVAGSERAVHNGNSPSRRALVGRFSSGAVRHGCGQPVKPLEARLAPPTPHSSGTLCWHPMPSNWQSAASRGPGEIHHNFSRG